METIINMLRGSVRVEVAGAFPERFLNLCAQRSISFWGVEWLAGGGVRLSAAGVDSRKLAPLAEKVLCTVTVVRKGGVPFFLSHFRKRYALLLGLALSLTAVCVLSRFILTVEVNGNENVPAAEIIAELRRVGVRIGAYGPGIDCGQATNQAMLSLEELSWMAINLYGTRAEILVRERIAKPALVDENICGDVIAEAPGIITHMEVLDGETPFQEGDTVLAGEVIINGNVKIEGPEYGTVETGWRQVRAAGRVYARTWRTLEAIIPLEAGVKEYTGRRETRFFLLFLGHRINFYGKSGISFAQYDKIGETWTMRLPQGQVMPLSLGRETVQEYVAVPTPLGRDAAEELLKAQLEAAVSTALGDGELVRTEYTTVEQDGMLTVTIRAECKEEIGKFVPFMKENT